MTEYITVANVDQLPAGERIVVESGETYIAVFNVAGTYYAVEDVCTHDEGPLAEGTLRDESSDNPKIECERHGATFELKTGKPTFPAVVPVRRFPVRVENGAIQVSITDPF